jgi:hypothetical protein
MPIVKKTTVRLEKYDEKGERLWETMRLSGKLFFSRGIMCLKDGCCAMAAR